MQFQPLEEIAENLEESMTRNYNLALFNRLLSPAPSPTRIVGRAICRTSAQLQPSTHWISPDSSYSDGEDREAERYGERKEGTGGSLPSGLGNDTQSAICSYRGASNTHTPLSLQVLDPEHEKDGLKNDKNEAESPLLKITPPLTRVQKLKMNPRFPASSNTNRSTPDFFSFQTIGDKAKIMNPQSSSGHALAGMTLFTVPSIPDVPHLASEEHTHCQRSISMDSHVNCLSNKAEE